MMHIRFVSSGYKNFYDFILTFDQSVFLKDQNVYMQLTESSSLSCQPFDFLWSHYSVIDNGGTVKTIADLRKESNLSTGKPLTIGFVCSQKKKSLTIR